MFNVLIKVFLKFRVLFFVVIFKGESLDKIFVLFLFNVFYWLIVIFIFVILVGVYKYINELFICELIIVVMLWNIFNLLFLLSVMSVFFECK